MVTTKLLEAAGQSETKKKKADEAIAWVKDLGHTAEKWAAAFTWKHLTLGANSTQRVESMNAAVKCSIVLCQTFIGILKKLSEFHHNQEAKAEELRRRREFRGIKHFDEALIPRRVTDVAARLTRYAARIELDQYLRSLKYRVTLFILYTHRCIIT